MHVKAHPYFAATVHVASHMKTNLRKFDTNFAAFGEEVHSSSIPAEIVGESCSVSAKVGS